jgi:hypothetical protein
VDWTVKVELFEQIRREYEFGGRDRTGCGQEVGRASSHGAGSSGECSAGTAEKPERQRPKLGGMIPLITRSVHFSVLTSSSMIRSAAREKATMWRPSRDQRGHHNSSDPRPSRSRGFANPQSPDPRYRRLALRHWADDRTVTSFRLATSLDLIRGDLRESAARGCRPRLRRRKR